MNALGPDVSFYQDDPNTARQVDFVQMKQAGAAYVIVRAGQNVWIDPDFAYNWMQAKDAGIPRGSYWYYDSRVDPVVQAQKWLSALAPTAFGADFGELPMFLDLEESYGGDYGGPDNWKTMLEYLRLRTSHELGIYTAFYYWRDHTESNQRPYFSQYPLWVANYAVSSPSIPPGWSDWLFWQFTSTGNGPLYGVESKGIDLNYFNGDANALKARFNLDGLPPEPPTTTTDRFTPLFDGAIVQVDIERYGASCHALVCDPDRVDFAVTDHFATTTRAVEEIGASVGINGGDWGSRVAEGIPASKPNSISVSSGRWIQDNQYESRPWFAVYRDGQIRIGHTNIGNPLHALSGDRYLVQNGAPNPALTSRIQEKNARTCVGLRADGKVVMFICDGWDYNGVTGEPPKGLTWNELAAVLVELGIVTGINLDGGGSTTMAVNQ